ncbi:hypothetical protein EMIT0210MI2_12428 [Priestia megaterium]
MLAFAVFVVLKNLYAEPLDMTAFFEPFAVFSVLLVRLRFYFLLI